MRVALAALLGLLGNLAIEKAAGEPIPSATAARHEAERREGWRTPIRHHLAACRRSS
jgi:hypothetical protein